MEVFRTLAYDDPVPQGESRLLELKGGRSWTATSPQGDGNWQNSNLHWVDVADEENFEESMKVLKRGGFDKILEAIGSDFESDGLMIAGMGFILLSHSNGSDLHRDNPGGGKDFFDLLFPLILPEDDVSQLYIGDDISQDRAAPLNLQPDEAILLGMDTWHKTGDCDYRKNNGLRVAVSVYVADVNEDNVELVASDGTALFPVPGQEDWFLAQKGRFWRKGEGIVKDKGRKPFSVEDLHPECPEWAEDWKCDTDLWGVRMKCLKSCEIYFDDDEYFSAFGDQPRNEEQ
jgi:hypothetical protein